MIEIVQQFREFKPYLKKRLAYIKQSGRDVELQEEVEDINFYLEVMKDILADESHGVDQLRSFIDRIHEMIRKNPLIDFQATTRRSLDDKDELGDNDHPRSPSPGARGTDSAANSIPLIPTHGAYRTVEVNFSSRTEHTTSNKDAEYDEWGSRNFENTFTRREHYKDVDMRESFYGGSSSNSSGRGHRRWSEENDHGGGARGNTREMGVGRGVPLPRRSDDYRRDRDNRHGRGRGFNDNDYDRYDSHQSGWFPTDGNRDRTSMYDVKPDRDLTRPPEWLVGASTPSNGSGFDDWSQKNDGRDGGFRANEYRRPKESDDWGNEESWGRNETRENKHNAHNHVFERRPSSEARREERQENFHSLYDRRPRSERPHEPSSTRTTMSSPTEYEHAQGHGESHSRGRLDDDRHIRPRIDSNTMYPPHSSPSPFMANMSIAPPQGATIGFGAAQNSRHFTNPSVIPPTSYGSINVPTYLPIPNVNLAIQNPPPSMGASVQHPMNFQQQPITNYGRSDIHSSPPGFSNVQPPPPQPRPSPQHSSEHYHGASPGYASPVETSAERVREITMMKAKQCFGRVVSRPSSSSVPHSSPGPSTMTPVSPGPDSPGTSDGNTSQGSSHSTLDPRINRSNRVGVYPTVQSRQQSPPAVPPPPVAATSRSDAGNILRPSADLRAKHKFEAERRKLQETRERVRQQEVPRSSSKVSKIQELRKQFEKEGLHRLGRPAKKHGGSFEDAIGTFENGTDAANKSVGKNKAASSNQPKEKDADEGRKGRSHSDKTDREKSPKKGLDKGKHKERPHGKNSDDKKGNETTTEKSPRKKTAHNNNPETSKGSSKAFSITDALQKGVQNHDQAKLAGFKIPRKPKPKEPEVEIPQVTDSISSDSSVKEVNNSVEVSESPPASPEPALSQVPDVENRMEDVEQSSTSKPNPQKSTASDVNPDALEFLKQFLISSAEPDDREFILANPENLKDFFFKIKSELSAAKGKRAEDNSLSTPGDLESERSLEEDVKERGRSKEKKKNAKRRSSLEKLHDALKEMRFDTMLPLGPRRCTRIGQEESEGADLQETASPQVVDYEMPTSSIVPDKKEGELDKRQPLTRKRGRPPKEIAKSTKGKSKLKDLQQLTDNQTETSEVEELVPEVSTSTARRGRKRKLKPTKMNPRKRSKKSGPVTRAQAALKKSKDISKKQNPLDETSQEKLNQEKVTRKKKTSTMLLRRITRKRLGPQDTIVNTGLGKIKIETDFALPVKPEPQETDSFLNTSNINDNIDQLYLADQLTNIINENLDNDTVLNMDKQTEDMDLDVFNTLDSDEQANEVCAKGDLNTTVEEEVTSELSYESILNSSVSEKPVKDGAVGDGSIANASSTLSNNIATTTACDTLTNANNSNSSSSNTEVINVTSVKPVSITEQKATDTLPVPDMQQEKTSIPEDPSSASLLLNEDLSSNHSNTIVSSEKEAQLKTESNTSFAAAVSPAEVESETAGVETKSILVEGNNLKVDINHVKSELMNMDELRKDVFKCDKCSYSGKKIVSHYVNKHFPCHIPQARLMPETFNGLIELNTSQSPQLLEIILDESHAQVWPCLYCDDRYDCIAEFFDHLTSHTGEFRYECGECGTSYPYYKSLVNHVKLHKGVAKNCVRFMFESVVEKKSRELSGFLCNDCYYFQLRFESIIRHIEQTGHSSLDVKSVRLIRPSANSTAQPTTTTTEGVTEAKIDVSSHTKESSAELEKDISEKKVEEKEISENKIDEKEISEKEINEKDISSENDAAVEQIGETENQCVFFGTDMSFSPPRVSINECSLAIPRVFEEPFLDRLYKKVYDDVIKDNENSGGDIVCESRKRKRSKEDDDDCSSKSMDAFSEINSTISENVEKTCAKSTFDHTLNDIPEKTPKEKWNPELEVFSEEPNDFFLSSDESSYDYSSESEDESEIDASTIDPKSIIKQESLEDEMTDESEVKQEDMVDVRNNEHLVKVRTVEENCELDKSYLLTRNLVTLPRPGDLYTPSTILFGYVMPCTNALKLRDSKEVDKLCTLYGKRIFSVKDPDRLSEMRSFTKLGHLFKCMASHCSYSTEKPNDFIVHLNVKHFKYANKEPLPGAQSCARFVPWHEVRMMKDAGCCAYCAARFREAKDLVDHIRNQHGQSAYQCSQCFYRSFYHRYVVRHFDAEHPNFPLHVLTCPMKVDTQTEEATLFQIFVYKCDLDNPECDKARRYVFREDFLDHLKECVSPLETYPCHLCKTQFPLDDIIEHYKSHNLFKFHCSYCQFGSEVKSDIDEHFVLVHPNTSGRVFYRLKQAKTQPPPNNVQTSLLEAIRASQLEAMNQRMLLKEQKKAEMIAANVRNARLEQASKLAILSALGSEGQGGSEASGADGGEQEDGEKGRVTNLIGCDLYRCVTGDCTFEAADSDSFKDHVTACNLVAESRSLACAHCERKLKTPLNLFEHMKVHGEKKQVCSLCPFRCWTSTEITKHVKIVHRVLSYKFLKHEIPDEVDPDIMVFPRDVAAKLCTQETLENSYYSLTRKAVYSVDNIDKLPLCKVFSSHLHCAICPYSTKVRSNIIRHLIIHKQAEKDGTTVVPQAPRINPVPYLSREGLEFDKMMNLAASSHKTNGGSATEADVRKLPQFVKEQFRYVCSICDHITSDDVLLQTHIKVIHSEVTNYQCPHCQKNPDAKESPESTVPLDKISHHLKLHGPKIYKCGHCLVVHHQIRLMEKHIPEKHPEKKPIHYLIRDVDPDGVPSSRPSTSANRRQSADDSKSVAAEKWKCFLCSSKTVLGSWEETKSHCEAVHKVNCQFMCLLCDFSCDDVYDMLSHCRKTCPSEDKNTIVVLFSKCETFETEDSSVTVPVWKRYGGAVRHIHGNFTEDSVALIRLYNSQQSNEQPPSASTSPVRGAPSLVAKNSVKPGASSAKARRSTGGSPSKIKTVLNVLTLPSAPKLEVFKYYCHKCDMYKTKNPNELRIHLFNEFRYKRWKCLICSTTFTTEKSLKGHIERDHQQVYETNLYELQPVNQEIESEIDDCIEKQNRKKDFINSFAVEKLGKLCCKHCNEEGLTYELFETHILQKHSG